LTSYVIAQRRSVSGRLPAFLTSRLRRIDRTIWTHDQFQRRRQVLLTLLIRVGQCHFDGHLRAIPVTEKVKNHRQAAPASHDARPAPRRDEIDAARPKVEPANAAQSIPRNSICKPNHWHPVFPDRFVPGTHYPAAHLTILPLNVVNRLEIIGE